MPSTQTCADTSVGVEGGDAGASRCCGKEVQPATTSDTAGQDKALDAELIEGTSDQRECAWRAAVRALLAKFAFAPDPAARRAATR